MSAPDSRDVSRRCLDRANLGRQRSGLEHLKHELHLLCGTIKPGHDSGLFRMAIDRSFTVAGSRDGRDRDGRLGTSRSRRRPGVASPRASRSCQRVAPARPARRPDRPGSARPSTWLVFITRNSIADKNSRHQATSNQAKSSRSKWSDSDGAERPLHHRGATSSTWEQPRYRRFCRSSRTTRRHLAYLSLPNYSSRSRLSRCLVNRSYSATRVRRRRWGGRVIQPSSRRYRRRDDSSIERLGKLASNDPLERLGAALTFFGLNPWSERRLCALTGLPEDQIQSSLATLESSGALVALPLGPRRTVRVLAAYATELEDRVLRALGRLHAARPRLSAIPRAHLSAALPDLANDALVAGLVDRLVARWRGGGPPVPSPFLDTSPS